MAKPELDDKHQCKRCGARKKLIKMLFKCFAFGRRDHKPIFSEAAARAR